MGVEVEIMGLIAYKKVFHVSKTFNLQKFIKELDEKDVSPFILHIEKSSTYTYQLSFEHIKMPLFASGLRRRNIGDEILLSESTLELLKSREEIRFIASIKNGTIFAI